jgi:hypothetical protein
MPRVDGAGLSRTERGEGTRVRPAHVDNFEQRPKFQRRGEALGSPCSDFQLARYHTPSLMLAELTSGHF